MRFTNDCFLFLYTFYTVSQLIQNRGCSARSACSIFTAEPTTALPLTDLCVLVCALVGVVAWFCSLQVQLHHLLHQFPQRERSRVEETVQTLCLPEALLTCKLFFMSSKPGLLLTFREMMTPAAFND